MLYVTHDQIEAMTLATRIGVLDHGALVQVGTPQQIYRDPVSSYVAARLGSPRINLLPRAATGTPAGAGGRGHRRRAARRHARWRWPTDTTAATRRRWCVASSTWATRSRCTSRSAATARSNCSRCAATPAASSPGRAVSVEFTAPLFFDAAGQRIAG